MAETIQAPFSSESDIKLFILYLLDAVAIPLDFVELHDVVVQNGLVKSFDFCLLFPELIDSGMIRAEKNEENETYTVTDRGRETLSALSDSILELTKERALKNAELLLSLKKTNSDFRTSIEELPQGGYRFTARFLKNLSDDLVVSKVCKERADAVRMQLAFERQPDTFCRSILSVLFNRAVFKDDKNPF